MVTSQREAGERAAAAARPRARAGARGPSSRFSPAQAAVRAKAAVRATWSRAAWIPVTAGSLVTAARPWTATPAFAVACRVRGLVRGLRAGAAGEGDRVAGGHPVEQVQVRQCLQAARRLPGERARRLVLLRPGHDTRVPSQGLRRRQVTAGQAHRA